MKLVTNARVYLPSKLEFHTNNTANSVCIFKEIPVAIFKGFRGVSFDGGLVNVVNHIF